MRKDGCSKQYTCVYTCWQGISQPLPAATAKKVCIVRVIKRRADGNRQVLCLQRNWLYRLYNAPAE
jgi:hypothetical protein